MDVIQLIFGFLHAEVRMIFGSCTPPGVGHSGLAAHSTFVLESWPSSPLAGPVWAKIAVRALNGQAASRSIAPRRATVRSLCGIRRRSTSRAGVIAGPHAPAVGALRRL